MKADREHDNLYLHESHYDDPKEVYKFCRVLANDENLEPGAQILDVGCAAGAFSYYIRGQFDYSIKISSIDVLPDLVEKAEKYVKGCDFKVGSAQEHDCYDDNFANLTFMIGVHSIFDDPLPIFDNLIHWTKPGGTVIIYGLFNRYPLDVYIRSRGQDDPLEQRETGWNMISQATVGKHLSAHDKVKEFNFYEFVIDLDIAKNKDDPLRSWTFRNQEGQRLLLNGLGLLHDVWALRISL